MKIYVISLADAVNRREQISAQLEAYQLSYEFFDAMRGNPDIAQNHNYAYDYREKMFGRQMTAGEIGCFMSHQELWRKIAAGNQPVCIMEDDVILTKNFARALSLLENYQNYEILRLSGIFNRKWFIWQHFSDLKLVKFWRDPMGTQCYIIKPEAAKRLLAKSPLINAPVDDFLGNYALHRLNVVGCDPYLIEHDWNIPSQLGHRHTKRKLSVLEKIRREFIIQGNGVMNFMIQLGYFLKTKLGLLK